MPRTSTVFAAGWCRLRRRTTCRGSRARPARRTSSTASPRTTCGSCHGGMWVSSSRRDARVGGRAPGLGAGEVQVGRVVRALEERRLAEEQVGVAGGLVQARADAAVAGVGERAAVGLDPQRVRRDRVRHLAGGDVNGPSATARCRRGGSRTPRSCPGPRRGRRPWPSARPCPPGPRPGSAAARRPGWYLRIT